MTKAEQSSSLLCVILLIAGVTGQDCIFKECQCVSTGIYCDGRGLTAIPQTTSTSNTNFDYLDLDTNNITRIPNGSLPANLREITMMQNPLTSIDDTAFNDSATTLKTLSFSTVSFARFPNAFLHLKNLNSLQIFDSNISDWNTDVMKTLGQSLNTLRIQNCPMNGWQETLSYFSNLSELYLSNNNISLIADDALDKTANSLTTLRLTSNSLTTVPKTFSKLSALTSLYLDQNKISDVSWLPQSSQMQILSLNMNNIFDVDQLNKALLQCADSINYLDLSSNRLGTIPNLGNLTKLETLILSQNRISDSISGSLPPRLKNFMLDANLFTYFPNVLQNAKLVLDMVLENNMIREIHDVDLPTWTLQAEFGNNLITELTDTSFPANSSLQYLHLDNNPISIISNNAFNNIPQLILLTMRNTRLTRVPVTLSAASKLKTLDLSGNLNLVCTCGEKSLQKWISSLISYMVSGDCGLTSIYHFYTVLSLDCPT